MTRTALAVCLVVFAAVFAAHFGWHAWREAEAAAKWMPVDGIERSSAWARYAERQDYYLGYSYALAGAFTAFAWMLAVQQRRREARGVLGGLTLMGGLWAAGCFLIGCCGSPMLAVYLSLFGASFLGFVKPIIAGITTLSVVLSGWALVRRARHPCCAPDEMSPTTATPPARTLP